MKTTTIEDNLLQRCVSDCEKAVITHVLKRTGGRLPEAAQLLGMNRKHLLGKIQEHGIDPREAARMQIQESKDEDDLSES